ncbi:MerR family transcriptional regulator [Qaidamihabitans albus]|uniref:MerR family transcriptional regulator n=1 Tax=Qaidamihabitans albus TaxID=2795733 RepID=UPI0018F1A6AC|nr:MerR family transcriptional regulator [Qaidamihabitans albus]
MARLSIGEFAQASGLTPKALRLYDELGLLRPARVDPRSGYRSYERAQLERARRVAWLRALGMPLARIRVVCDLPPAAAAAEVMSYWRQVEADTAARAELATFLVDRLSREDTHMTEVTKVDLRSAARTDRGLVRQANEDAVHAGTRLFALADGFGGPGTDGATGSVAIEALGPLDADVSAGRLLQVLSAAVRDARAAVRDFTGADPAHAEAGTTLTAMLWSGSAFALAHVGDSRAYVLRGGELTGLTYDHTFVQSLVDEGKLTAGEALSHPQRARLIRALHRDDTTEPDLHLREAHDGDRYLLCSDGLHAVLPERSLRQVLGDADTPREAVDEMTERVHAAGAPDNVSCVVVDVHAR